MKTKLRLNICLLICLVLTLSGCQLAQETAVKQQERLIGVFVTTEYLDLFDMEGYLTANLDKLSPGGNLVLDGKDSRYEGRLYAELVPQILTDEETGATEEVQEFVFREVEGISYFAATMPATEERESFISTVSDEAISDGHTALNYGDDEEQINLRATIYLADGYNGKTYYTNPVYQSADGKVYAVTGSGFTAGDENSTGGIFTTKLTESITTEENGKSKIKTTSIELSLAGMNCPEKIRVLQMDQHSRVIFQEEYDPGQLPERLTPQQETAYIIVESISADQPSRSIYDAGSEGMETFYGREDGICHKQWTELVWLENEAAK